MNHRLTYLYKLYCENRCTPAEWEELMVLMDHPENEEQVAALIDQLWDKTEFEGEGRYTFKQVLKSILKRPQRGKRLSVYWYALMAASICGLFIGIYFLLPGRVLPIPEPKETLVRLPDVAPGDDKALLILEDGQKIDLEGMQDAQVFRIKDVQVKKMGKGWVAFEPDNYDRPLQSTKALKNTVLIPRGGQYKVTLPDGSLVTLNAGSSLSFPSSFSGNRREVMLNGEAFFDVRSKTDAGNAASPFIVRTAKQDVKVLGTTFNLQAYPDQTIHYTTLLSGSVKICTGTESGNPKYRLLKPGQQAIVKDEREAAQVRPVNLEEVTAWKDGYFFFNNEPLGKIMDQVSRWYDVDIQYTGNTKELRFFGIYARSGSLKSLLKNLEQTGKIRFDIWGKEAPKRERRVIVKAYNMG